jgi:lon-related putative ATP-dependent protease
MASSLSKYEVAHDKLRWTCESADKVISATDHAKASSEIIGQERAVDAIRLGLRVEQPGYNVFIVGYTGTGRSTAIRKMLEDLGLEEGNKPPDICYVNNFQNPDRPRSLIFDAGMGAKFRDEMKDLIDQLRDAIPQLVESDEMRERRRGIVKKYEERQKKHFKSFEEKVKERNFVMTQIQLGTMARPDVSPVIGGEPTSLPDLEARTEAGEFPRDRFDEIKKTYEELSDDMARLFKEVRNIQRDMREELRKELDSAVTPIVAEIIEAIKDKFSADGLVDYLDEVKNDILKNLTIFGQPREQQQDQQRQLTPLRRGPDPEAAFTKYQVNVLIDNSKTKGKPIITEVNPNYHNLFGSIEVSADPRGIGRTDFTKIKSGALHRANGGYLILDAMDALIEPGVWQGLKRSLRSGELEIQAYNPVFMFSHSAMKPESIKLDVQVIMIGMPKIYYLLYFMDPDFSKIFKIKAEFDTVMDLNDENLSRYGNFARKIVDDNELLQFNKEGMGAIIEHGVRLAGRKNKISTRFHVIKDIMRESSYWARQENSDSVSANHVEKAIDEWIRRVSMIEDKMNEMVEEGIILIDTEGEVVGQINGLSVLSLGEYMFGKPTRITARTSVGGQGIINVEKEAQLSGSVHSKGVMIISGYLQGKFAQRRPLSINAHLCFEQSYGGVDGDSASSTEIYAILSSLAQKPIRQDIAVTGSVNQNGTIQAIGGVNEKIEGFYKTCKLKGLTGKQGVMIPAANVPNLLLRNEVANAVEDGQFHIYAVNTIEEGIEILTGMEAGIQQQDGSYPEGTLFNLVEKKLDLFAETYRKYFNPIVKPKQS